VAFGLVLPARIVYGDVHVALAAQGLVVKHVDAVEVRIVVAAVLAAAADVVLVADRLPILGAHLVTAKPVEEVVLRQEERGRNKGWGEEGGGQVINNSATVQQER